MALFKKYTLLEYLLLGVLIASNPPWFLWAYDLGGIVLYICVIAVLIIFIKEKRLRSKNGVIGFCLLFLYFIVLQFSYTIHKSYIFICLFYLIAANLSSSESKNILSLSTNYVFLSIIVPLPLWLIHQFVFPIPIIGYIDTSTFKGLIEAQICENHFFFITLSGLDAMRFYSWYDEPGVLGTLASLILWGNRYNIKDYKNVVIIIGGVFTFSLAFYVLFIIGSIYYGLQSLKKAIITISLFVLLGTVSFNVLKENDAFQASIVGRVENIGELGVDSRVGIYDIDGLWNRAQRNNGLILGLGSGYMNEYGGISKMYKTFILEFGYVGVLLLLFVYLILIKNRNCINIFTLVLFLLSFMQRPQLFTAYELLLFVCIINSLGNVKDGLKPKLEYKKHLPAEML